jgi:hypothetical protein
MLGETATRRTSLKKVQAAVRAAVTTQAVLSPANSSLTWSLRKNLPILTRLLKNRRRRQTLACKQSNDTRSGKAREPSSVVVKYR